MIKVINNRKFGSLYHYAHFICDCLFVEIIEEIYKHEFVYRQKTLHQTIGNFNKIYQHVMKTINIELNEDDFNKNDCLCVSLKNKEDYMNLHYFNIFRNYIFNRYNVKKDKNYPKVLLIKRGLRINLISDLHLSKINKNITTGSERREIKDIHTIENYMKNKYKNDFELLILENIDFEQQVKYFYNADIIVCAHGAGMSNMFFCNKNTKILEITCNKNYPFFDIISKILELKHLKCEINESEEIIKRINTL
jgi:hypothetical protein